VNKHGRSGPVVVAEKKHATGEQNSRHRRTQGAGKTLIRNVRVRKPPFAKQGPRKMLCLRIILVFQPECRSKMKDDDEYDANKKGRKKQAQLKGQRHTGRITFSHAI
jgi:hypothetical protein